MLMTKNALAGLLFALAGGGAAMIARSYPAGTALDMGPGYFPNLVSGALVLVGVALVASSFLNPGSGQPIKKGSLKSLLAVTGSIVVFGLLMTRLGLVIAVAGLVAISAFAGKRMPLPELAAIIVVMVVLTAGIFVVLLKMPLDLWP